LPLIARRAVAQRLAALRWRFLALSGGAPPP